MLTIADLIFMCYVWVLSPDRDKYYICMGWCIDMAEQHKWN